MCNRVVRLSVFGCLALGACLADDPVAPGPAPVLEFASGSTGSDTIGSALAAPVVVQALDSVGSPLAGLTLRVESESVADEPGLLFAASPGAAPVGSLELLTGADGQAMAYVTLGARAGVAALHVVHPTTGAAIKGSYDVQPGRAASLELSPKDTVLTDGTVFRPRRYVYDRAGNPITRALAYTVTGSLRESAGSVFGDGVGTGTATATLDGLSTTVGITVVPDGYVVVGGYARTGLKSSRLDGTQVVTRDVPGAVLWVDTAPSGKGVAFSFNFLVARDSVAGPNNRLTPSSLDAQLTLERWPRFSTDGYWVYFEAVRGSRSEIWRTRPTGSLAEQLTPGAPPGIEDAGDRYPAISQDGHRLAYAADRSATSDAGSLEIMDLRTRVVTATGQPALSSRWSPDDSWIVFVTPDYELRRIRPDGTDVATLTTVPFGVGFDWSPDGTYILGLSPDGDPQLLEFATGLVLDLPHLGRGQTTSISWYDDWN